MRRGSPLGFFDTQRSRPPRVIPASAGAALAARTAPNWSGHLTACHAPCRCRPSRPRRLYRQIADQLRELIERGEFAVGTRLPPERDLAVQLGVSRPSVREALIALEVEGLVEVRMGSGIYVREPDPARRARRAAQAESPLETIRARQLIEGELAALRRAAHEDGRRSPACARRSR